MLLMAEEQLFLFNEGFRKPKRVYSIDDNLLLLTPPRVSALVVWLLGRSFLTRVIAQTYGQHELRRADLWSPQPAGRVNHTPNIVHGWSDNAGLNTILPSQTQPSLNDYNQPKFNDLYNLT
ncbi:hypothetical protein J6590_046892 [Homalodisca vitripennis]|nr:hypothetical protein J6590_046892 [Homalodisca vitripennis]